MATFVKRGDLQWRAQIRRKGYPQQSGTFNTKSEAEAWAATVESEMVRGVFVSRTEAENTTLSEAMDRYLHEVSAMKKGAAVEAVRIRYWKKTILSQPARLPESDPPIWSYGETVVCGESPPSGPFPEGPVPVPPCSGIPGPPPASSEGIPWPSPNPPERLPGSSNHAGCPDIPDGRPRTRWHRPTGRL